MIPSPEPNLPGARVGPDANATAQLQPVTPPPTREPTLPAPNVPDTTVYERSEPIETTRFHIVRKNETLSAISKQYYGTAHEWNKILEANRDAIIDANKITPGTKLIIPD
jgi:nucleoid-associated protein YgaU